MIEQDTIKLLRECDAGIAMGISAITDVYDKASDEKLKKALLECKIQHEELKTELEAALERFGDDGKDPNGIYIVKAVVRQGDNGSQNVYLKRGLPRNNTLLLLH